jgi:hypothetical protein
MVWDRGTTNFYVESNPKISSSDLGAWLTGPLPCSKIMAFAQKASFFEKNKRLRRAEGKIVRGP